MSKRAFRLKDYVPVALSLFVACALTIVPLPMKLVEFRPEWVCMVVFYWAAFHPERFGITAAWLSGLLLDILDGSLLGMQALSVSAIGYVALRLHSRLAMYPFSYQSVIVFLVVGIHLTAGHWIQGLFGVVSGGYGYLIPALSSGLVWTFVALMLIALQRGFRW